MLDKEHFVAARAPYEKKDGGWEIDGFGITTPNEVRRWMSIAVTGEDGGKAIHVRNSDRYYRLIEAPQGGVYVEGFVGWSFDRDRKNPFLFPEEMVPIRVSEVGAITSFGQRISPHDERLDMLAHDLSMGTSVPEARYLDELSRVNDHR